MFRRQTGLPERRSLSLHDRSVVRHALETTTADNTCRDITENETMSQITKTAEINPRTSDETYGRAITVSLTLTAAIIVAAFLLTRPFGAIPPGHASGTSLTDGFLPGAMAAHAAVQARSAQALADGWEARLVGPMHAAQNAVRDGWEAGLVGGIAATPHAVRDGWEAGLVAPNTTGNEVRDGWESSLFK